MKYAVLAAVASAPLVLGGCAAVGTALATHSGTAAVAAAVEYGPIALAAGVVGAIGISGVAGVEPAVSEPGTFGAFLQDSQASVQAQVDKAMQNQRETVVVAGLQARGALLRARSAFKGSLNKKIAGIGVAEARYKQEIESVLAGLGDASDAAVKAAGDRAQAIADDLRSAVSGPQVNSYGPIFLFPSLPFQPVRVKGSFPASYEGAAVPQLSVNGKSLNAFDFRSDSLSFSLLTADLGVDEPRQIVWKKAQVAVPWSNPNRFSSVQVEKFDVELGILPYSFGRATMDHRVVTVRREEKTRLSDSFSFDAAEAQIDAVHCLTLTPQERSDGWKILVGSSIAVLDKGAAADAKGSEARMVLRTQGEHSVCWQTRAPRDVAFEAEESRADKVWHIEARIARDVNESAIESESFDLSWGAKRTFAYPAGTWKLRYSKFGAGAVEVDSGDLSSPLIKVNSDGRSVLVSTYPH